MKLVVLKTYVQLRARPLGTEEDTSCPPPSTTIRWDWEGSVRLSWRYWYHWSISWRDCTKNGVPSITYDRWYVRKR